MESLHDSAPVPVTIRPFEDRDTDRLLALIAELQQHQHALFDRMKHPEEMGGWYLEQLQQDCERHSGIILVADIGETLAGYAVLLGDVKQEDADEQDYSYAYISELMVTERARSQGIGADLLQACQDLAIRLGAKWLRISVLARNVGAVSLYRRFGFADHLIEMEKPLDNPRGQE